MQARQEQSVSGKLHGLAQAALRYARARLDLLQHEWQEERSRLLKLLARSALFAFGLLTTYQLTAAAIIIAFWDTAWRMHSMLCLIAITAGISYYAWRSLQAAIQPESQALAVSIAEFEKDRLALAQLAEETARPSSGSTVSTTADDIVKQAAPPKSARHRQTSCAAQVGSSSQ